MFLVVFLFKLILWLNNFSWRKRSCSRLLHIISNLLLIRSISDVLINEYWYLVKWMHMGMDIWRTNTLRSRVFGECTLFIHQILTHFHQWLLISLAHIHRETRLLKRWCHLTPFDYIFTKWNYWRDEVFYWAYNFSCSTLYLRNVPFFGCIHKSVLVELCEYMRIATVRQVVLNSNVW